VNRALFPVLFGLSVALSGLGCDRLLKERKRVENLLASAESAAASPAPPPPAPVATTTAASPAAATIADDQIPTPEDFEQQAAREITPEKMPAELERLKKDIGP
jgi:hypothetical protein